MGPSGPETKSNVSEYVSCCNQDSNEYGNIMISRVNGDFKFNIARGIGISGY